MDFPRLLDQFPCLVEVSKHKGHVTQVDGGVGYTLYIAEALTQGKTTPVLLSCCCVVALVLSYQAKVAPRKGKTQLIANALTNLKGTSMAVNRQGEIAAIMSHRAQALPATGNPTLVVQ